jgi:hypothetical protein
VIVRYFGKTLLGLLRPLNIRLYTTDSFVVSGNEMQGDNISHENLEKKLCIRLTDFHECSFFQNNIDNTDVYAVEAGAPNSVRCCLKYDTRNNGCQHLIFTAANLCFFAAR